MDASCVELVSVRFTIHYVTQYGESLYVCGNISRLGNWRTGKAMKMKWHENNDWTAEVIIPREETFEYKYFISSDNMKFPLKWEQGNNRSVDLMMETVNQSRIELRDAWGITSQRQKTARKFNSESAVEEETVDEFSWQFMYKTGNTCESHLLRLMSLNHLFKYEKNVESYESRIYDQAPKEIERLILSGRWKRQGRTLIFEADEKIQQQMDPLSPDKIINDSSPASSFWVTIRFTDLSNSHPKLFTSSWSLTREDHFRHKKSNGENSMFPESNLDQLFSEFFKNATEVKEINEKSPLFKEQPVIHQYTFFPEWSTSEDFQRVRLQLYSNNHFILHRFVDSRSKNQTPTWFTLYGYWAFIPSSSTTTDESSSSGSSRNSSPIASPGPSPVCSPVLSPCPSSSSFAQNESSLPATLSSSSLFLLTDIISEQPKMKQSKVKKPSANNKTQQQQTELSQQHTYQIIFYYIRETIREPTQPTTKSILFEHITWSDEKTVWSVFDSQNQQSPRDANTPSNTVTSYLWKKSKVIFSGDCDFWFRGTNVVRRDSFDWK